jgi:hypothetical protein
MYFLPTHVGPLLHTQCCTCDVDQKQLHYQRRVCSTQQVVPSAALAGVAVAVMS